MRTVAFSLALAGTPFLALLLAQEGRRAAEPQPETPTPIAVAQGASPILPGAPLPLPESKHRGLTVGGGVRAVLDDAVPLPGRARVVTGAEGDQVVAAGGGDPDFLSFAGASHYPPAAEQVDPALLHAAAQALAAGRSETYAFVMFRRRMTPARIQALESLGIRTLSFHPHYCLKVAIPVAAIDACAALDFVRWVGLPTPQQKVHPVLAAQLARDPAAGSVPVWIDVFDSDMTANARREVVGTAQSWNAGVDGGATPSPAVRVQSGGWQERALAELGIETTEYVDSIRAFRARLSPAALESLVALDFVQFVEPDIAPSLAHDESTPMVSNDIVRAWYNGGSSQAVTVGEVDSGADGNHQDFTNVWGAGFDLTNGAGAFTDGCEHGSHVLGTILGGGNVIPSLKGNAPGLARYGGTGRAFVAKIFDNACASTGVALSAVTSVMHTDYFDGFSISPRPIAINNSWGTRTSSGVWIGSEANARILDAEVYSTGQAWIFAAGNEGATGSTLRQEASAKNVLTVGAVTDYVVNGYDPGILAPFSSTGPCGDGRWKPNVCAPGTQIRSVDANSGNGYQEMSGTSMATPHVTGLVAQLCDAVPWMRYRSCAIQSVVMASATTKDDQVLTAPPTAYWEHMNTFGTGRVDGMRAILGTGDSWWNTWTFDQPSSNWNYADFTVPAGTKRIVVCMHYDEEACSPGAGRALVNDWDLYIDQEPIDPNGNAGDWVAQQSSKDNTEIRILDNPTPGAWRWKVWPQAATANSVARMGMTVYFVMGATKPTMAIQTAVTDSFVKPGETTSINTLVWNTNSFNASAAFLDVGDIYGTVHSATMNLYDGSVANLLNNHQGGRDVLLGNIPFNYARAVDWSMSWQWEGIWPWAPMVRGDNFAAVADNNTYVTVDGTPPAAPSAGSTTHTPWVWSNAGLAQFFWSTPSDNLSGVEGYAVAISVGSPQDPGTTMNLGAVNNWSAVLLSSSSPSYLNLRAVDRCGNWSPPSSAGPYYVDYSPPPPATNVGSTLSPGYWVGGNGLSSFHGYWDPVFDPESGIAGYGVVFDQNPGTIPAWFNLPANATTLDELVTVSGGYYLHVRAFDGATNGGATVHAGPYLYNLAPNKVYCTAKVNSLGCTPSISAVNHGSVYYTSNFVVSCSNVRNNKPGLLLYGINGPASGPFQGGILCVRAPVKRATLVNSGGNPNGNDCTGIYSIDMNVFANGGLGGTPIPELLIQGTTVWCQWWGRDPGFPAPNNTTLSNALEYFVCYF